MSSKLKIALVMSSTREGRLNDQVTKFVHHSIAKNHNVEIIDPATIEFPKTQHSMDFLFNPTGNIPENIRALNEKMKGFDAFLIVCAEYNYSLPPPLANLFDNISPATLVWKPCGFVNYSIGQFGGCRVGVQLRAFTGALGMISVPKQMSIPFAHEKIAQDGTPVDEKLTKELNLVLEHVYWAANALKMHKTTVTPPPWAI
ncbi:uncharacterized protein LOC123540699 [Mercenaria mercenaria]|uniref:uncharacterized protein LOC123540699 n=1 Tax=Mercenaria mercenaria TaxID=6596 RepID=UPI00234FA0C4|nr:uncharacterized protein LOC123540699 [Mercenaria mercenaria]XP_053383418.1 uncharacterized protein LOC123540699 [Mercenaria mercenaria]